MAKDRPFPLDSGDFPFRLMKDHEAVAPLGAIAAVRRYVEALESRIQELETRLAAIEARVSMSLDEE